MKRLGRVLYEVADTFLWVITSVPYLIGNLVGAVVFVVIENIEV